jgi:hypothetical protein
MDTNTCPKCDASLLSTDTDERSITPVNYGGRRITRIVGVRYYYKCGTVVFYNERYLDGAIEIDCQAPR